jgi:hypothetical protein
MSSSHEMKIGRFIVRLVAAWILAIPVTGLLFCVVAWSTGQWPGDIHSSAALVLLLGPFMWAGAFWVLARAGFPPSDAR